MKTFDDYFSGSWLKAANLNGKKHKLTIKGIGEFESQDGKTQPTLEFNETDKQLGLNKTNATVLSELIGTKNLEEWIGHRIQIYPTKTDFGGKRVDCIRVSDDFHEGPQKAKSKAAPSTLDGGDELTEHEDEIPF